MLKNGENHSHFALYFLAIKTLRLRDTKMFLPFLAESWNINVSDHMYSILPQNQTPWIRTFQGQPYQSTSIPGPLGLRPLAAADSCLEQRVEAGYLVPFGARTAAVFFFEKPMVLAGHRLRTTTSWGTFFATDHGAGHPGGDLGSEVQCSGAKLRGHSTAREVPGCSQHPNTSPNTFGAKLVDKEVQLVIFSTLQLSFTYNGLERPCNMTQCRNHDLGVPGWGVSYGKLGARFYSVITWSFHV